MSSISDVVTSVKAVLQDRIKSPFIATFIIVFLYYYWPIIFFIFDKKKDADGRIKAISDYLQMDGMPGVFYLIGLTLIAVASISLISVIAYFFKELAEGWNKKIRNALNPDFINSQKYTQAISALTNQTSNLTESNALKEAKISMLIQIINLTDSEKKLLYKASINSGKLDRKNLTDEEEERANLMHKDGIWGINDKHYTITNKDLGSIAETYMIPPERK